MKRMNAKYPGKCTNGCERGIKAGDAIIFYGRGRAAHVDCNTAKLAGSLCTACNGSGSLWNNAPCKSCDGTGSRTVQDLAKTQPHAPDVDAMYEDDCARQCGLL